MKIKLTKLPIYFIGALLLFASCNLPKDPNSSWQKAQKEGLKVGVVDNPPFTNTASDSFSGNEIEIINKFASSNKIEVSFLKGNESDLIEKLEKFELDMVIGGFNKKTVWSKKAGLSRPYDKEHVFLVPKGENKLLVKLEEYIHKNLENEKS